MAIKDGVRRMLSLQRYVGLGRYYVLNQGTANIALLLILLFVFLFGPSEDLVLAQAPPATLDWIEVTQAIQDLNNSVPLVAGKKTLVRAYLTLGAGPSRKLLNGGKLVVQPSSGPPITINSINSPDLTNQSQIGPKRLSLGSTLNFVLDSPVSGSYKLAIKNDLTDAGGVVIPCPKCGTDASSYILEVPFHPSPPLKIKLLTVQYLDSTQMGDIIDLPENKEFDLIKSWLKRAYPVSQDSTILSITDDQGQPPLKIDINGESETDHNAPFKTNYKNYDCNYTNFWLNEQFERDSPVSTHYVGLVSDHDPIGSTNNADYFKRGCTPVMSPPQLSLQDYFANPGSVATGKQGLGEPPWFENGGTSYWDHDGSYGDWYTGHELGHALGRFHAIGSSGSTSSTLCVASIENPVNLPQGHPNGQLSDSTNTYIGYDSGDPALGISPQLLPGQQWHDLMTYCVRQWISAPTYIEIRCRLHTENGQACPTTDSGDTTPPGTPTGLRLSDLPNPKVSPVKFHYEKPTVTTEESDIVRTSHENVPSVPTDSPAQRNEYLSILSVVNLKDRRGHIEHIAHFSRKPTVVGRKDDRAQIRFSDKNGNRICLSGNNGKQICSFPVTVPTDQLTLSDNGKTDWVTVDVPRLVGIAAIQLTLADVAEPVDHRLISPTPPTVANIRVGQPTGKLISEDTLELTWEANDDDKLLPLFAKAQLTYMVELSWDGGSTWKIIAVNLNHPLLAVPRGQLKNVAAVIVRVTADDGFNTTTATSPLIKLANTAARP